MSIVQLRTDRQKRDSNRLIFGEGRECIELMLCLYFSLNWDIHAMFLLLAAQLSTSQTGSVSLVSGFGYLPRATTRLFRIASEVPSYPNVSLENAG